jgi:hypothetical protein
MFAGVCSENLSLSAVWMLKALCDLMLLMPDNEVRVVDVKEREIRCEEW